MDEALNGFESVPLYIELWIMKWGGGKSELNNSKMFRNFPHTETWGENFNFSPIAPQVVPVILIVEMSTHCSEGGRRGGYIHVSNGFSPGWAANP